MKYRVDEVENTSDKNIIIRISGEDISFTATNYGVSIYLDEKTADSIAFNIQTILQDRERKKSEKNS